MFAGNSCAARIIPRHVELVTECAIKKHTFTFYDMLNSIDLRRIIIATPNVIPETSIL